MNLLKGKIALVTGGSRGIGKAIVETFVKNGAYVIFTFLNSNKQAKIIESNFNNGSIESYQIDINNLELNKSMVTKILNKFGKIDILVNNVGITRDNILLKISYEDWSNVIKTNLTSVFFLTKIVIKNMLYQKYGSIINISSIVGSQGNFGQSNYCASKAGIIGFTKAISKEFGSRNIRCNVVSPGVICTDMIKNKENIIITENNIPLKRYGTSQEVANTCLFLASDLSSYITGETINVNGGL